MIVAEFVKVPPSGIMLGTLTACCWKFAETVRLVAGTVSVRVALVMPSFQPVKFRFGAALAVSGALVPTT